MLTFIQPEALRLLIFDRHSSRGCSVNFQRLATYFNVRYDKRQDHLAPRDEADTRLDFDSTGGGCGHDLCCPVHLGP
eukprot:s1265_g7.t1